MTAAVGEAFRRTALRTTGVTTAIGSSAEPFSVLPPARAATFTTRVTVWSRWGAVTLTVKKVRFPEVFPGADWVGDPPVRSEPVR